MLGLVVVEHEIVLGIELDKKQMHGLSVVVLVHLGRVEFGAVCDLVDETLTTVFVPACVALLAVVVLQSHGVLRVRSEKLELILLSNNVRAVLTFRSDCRV